MNSLSDAKMSKVLRDKQLWRSLTGLRRSNHLTDTDTMTLVNLFVQTLVDLMNKDDNASAKSFEAADPFLLLLVMFYETFYSFTASFI